MTYVEKVLGETESIVFCARFHWLETAKAWFYLLIFGILVFGIFLFAYVLVRIHTTEIVVTNRRFIMKTGWITRSTQEMGLETIEEVQLEQGVLGRLFGFGQLRVSGTGDSVISTPAIIAHPSHLRKAISDAQDIARNDLDTQAA